MFQLQHWANAGDRLCLNYIRSFSGKWFFQIFSITYSIFFLDCCPRRCFWSFSGSILGGGSGSFCWLTLVTGKDEKHHLCSVNVDVCSLAKQYYVQLFTFSGNNFPSLMADDAIQTGQERDRWSPCSSIGAWFVPRFGNTGFDSASWPCLRFFVSGLCIDLLLKLISNWNHSYRFVFFSW